MKKELFNENLNDVQKINKNDIIRYERRATLDLSDEEIKACSTLFSSSYGMYNAESPIRPGKQIRMSEKYYKEKYCKKGVFLIRAMDHGNQVGHAIYLRQKYKPYGIITWVLQLVVDRDYRMRGIASKLLRSIWGFSDDYAWGLASANPCTVRTLESVTFRKCDPSIIQNNLNAIKLIGRDTTFVKDDSYVVGDGISQVDTEFFADNSDYVENPECEGYLGKLRPGHEWLAFTFRKQSIDKKSFKRHFYKMMRDYEGILQDAYGRMQVLNHNWAKGEANEITFFRRFVSEGKILDIGCGIGRHSSILAKNGFNVIAIDNSPSLIEQAKKIHSCQKLHFEIKDARDYKCENEFDAALCLFDVVGSYPYAGDNKRILKTAYNNLKSGGIFMLSVMNMELTERLIDNKNKGYIRTKPEILINLPPSKTMQKTGAIFDGKYLAYDKEHGLVYRKEQFDNDYGLPAEYIIRDKRYYGWEISEILEKVGFEIIELRYVQAGHFDVSLDPTDTKAKEICVVCRKPEF